MAALTATTGAFSGILSPAALVDISGAAAGQIKFPAAQNASTNANTLDDYEEGTFTPTIGGSGGQSGQAYTTQNGNYIKVGKVVHAWVNIVLSTLGTITTNAQIQSLPFTSENTSGQIATFAIGTWANFTTTLSHLSGVMDPNATVITLRHAAAAAQSTSPVLQADMAATTTIVGYICYRASA